MGIFAYTQTHTPLFSTKEIASLFRHPIPFDAQSLLRPLETILLPGSLLFVEKEEQQIFQIRSEEYPSSSPLYVDKRFIKLTQQPEKKVRLMPSKFLLQKRLFSYPKRPYIWGGNCKNGVPELFTYYPPKQALTHYEWLYWHFRGVDCSGLLYEISDGATPRNTKELCHFGYEVKSPKPLDMIVWPGHVILFLTKTTVIEAKAIDGITVSKAYTRLKEIEPFPYQIRRWV